MALPWKNANIYFALTQEECKIIVEHRNAFMEKANKEIEVENKKLKKRINQQNKILNRPPLFDVSDEEKEFDNDDEVVET